MQFFKRIKRAAGLLVHGADRLDTLAENLAQANRMLETRTGELHERISQTDAALREVSEARPSFLERFATQLTVCPEANEVINRSLSTHKTLWGSAERLHISPKADVFTCFFNTNSGSVTVGDYSFAGSGVSLLAGSHDPHLTGLMRRDAELKDGCDIVVGKGVWLASGCTLLGPCTVGDNAVVAAGAVVVPGTHVPANTIYGGIPAREIGRLELEHAGTPGDPSTQRAIVRNGGVLYVDGWSSKKDGVAPFFGYWLEGREGLLLVDRRNWTLRFFLGEAPAGALVFSGSKGDVEYRLSGNSGTMEIELPCEDSRIEEIRVRPDAGTGRLFMVLE